MVVMQRIGAVSLGFSYAHREDDNPLSIHTGVFLRCIVPSDLVRDSYSNFSSSKGKGREGKGENMVLRKGDILSLSCRVDHHGFLRDIITWQAHGLHTARSKVRTRDFSSFRSGYNMQEVRSKADLVMTGL